MDVTKQTALPCRAPPGMCTKSVNILKWLSIVTHMLERRFAKAECCYENLQEASKLESNAMNKTWGKGQHVSDTALMRQYEKYRSRLITGRSVLEGGFASGEITLHKVYKIKSSCTFPIPPGQVSAPLTAPRALQAARLPSWLFAWMTWRL
jgi:hypothetical protein